MSLVVMSVKTETAAELRAAVQEALPTTGFLSASSPIRTVLVDRREALGESVANDASRWMWGHAFSRDGEARWRHTAGRGFVVWAGMTPQEFSRPADWFALPGSEAWTQVAHDHIRPDTLLVWSPNDQRIGHDVPFPASLSPGANGLIIRIQEYDDDKGPAWCRYLAVEAPTPSGEEGRN